MGRMNWRTGSDALIAVIVSAKAGRARLSSLGVLFSRSVRSLLGPGLWTSRRRAWIVGTASATSGRRSARKGASLLVAGLDAATSTSRSLSVWRRFTKVVLALRSVPGSSPSARPSATFSDPIADVVVLVLETRSVSVVWRAARVVTTRDDVLMK